MNNAEIVTSHEVIHGSVTADQEAAFSEVIEGLEEADYAAINDYLNAGVEPGSDWHEYLDAFSRYEWFEFGYAFKHVLGRDLSLD